MGGASPVESATRLKVRRSQFVPRMTDPAASGNRRVASPPVSLRFVYWHSPLRDCCDSGPWRFVGHPLGKILIMDRTKLLAGILDAATPNETSTAIYDARRWLIDHPDDQMVRYAMAGLMGVERKSLSRA